MLTTTGYAPQPVDAFLIFRIEDGVKRVLNTTYSEVNAERSVGYLRTAYYNEGLTGRTYGYERNPKYHTTGAA